MGHGSKSLNLEAGEWVEVLSQEEILATLDARGQLEGLPFMPEMLASCGKRFKVWRRAHKTCDTVNRTGGRWMTRAVHLEESRCDGQAHGGCEAACLVFWKEAWLKRVDGPGLGPAAPAPRLPVIQPGRGCTEQDVHRAVRAPGDANDADPTYACQATLLPEYTTLLKWWDVRQYVEDCSSGNVGLWALIQGGSYVVFHFLIRKLDRRSTRLLSRLLIRLYDGWQALVGGVPYPRRWGQIPVGQKTPAPPPLGLQPGELVRVKSYDAILATLDQHNKNRGMFFDAEEVPYCGKTVRVRSHVRRIVNERTGKMLELKGNNVILEDVYCKGWYSDRRMHCPRAIYSFWRETWLERPEQEKAAEAAPQPAGAPKRAL
jgi:hypothetical protein